MQAMSENRIIKKYPNRRLYDTEISRYITLEDVRQLVLDGIDFCVKDVKTDQDLTHSILMHIIAEQEYGPEPLFSTQTLTHIIRSYKNPQHNLLSEYLKKCLNSFQRKQEIFLQEIKKQMAAETTTEITDLNDSDFELWQEIKKTLTNPGVSPASKFNGKN